MHKQSPWSVRIPGLSRNLSVQEVESIKEKGRSVTYFVLGCGVLLGEIALRKTANAFNVASEAIADVHTGYVSKVEDTPVLSEAVRVVETRNAVIVTA